MWISSFFQSVTACSCWLQADIQIWVATGHPSFEMSLRPFSFTKQVLVRLDLLKYWRKLQLARTISSVARKCCSSQVTLACLHRVANSSELRFRFSLRRLLYRQHHRLLRLFGLWYFCIHFLFFLPVSCGVYDYVKGTTSPTDHLSYPSSSIVTSNTGAIRMAWCRVHRHLLNSAIMVCLMGHTAVQTSVAEGFLAMEATMYGSVSLV